MDYSPTLCFASFNSKRRKIQQEKREKEQLQQSMSRQSFVCRDKRPSKWHIKYPVATLIIATWKILLRHCMKKLCREKEINITTLEDKVFGPDRETKS